MRTRLFLRTSEFLWQEGHTAHVDREDALDETLTHARRSTASSPRDVLAMPVIAGEKPENERFPAPTTPISIEAMMQDGKALQAGTSHYLGTQLRPRAEHPLPERRGASSNTATPRAGAFRPA